MNIVFMNGLFGVDLRHPLSGSELPVNVVPQTYSSLTPLGARSPDVCVCVYQNNPPPQVLSGCMQYVFL